MENAQRTKRTGAIPDDEDRRDMTLEIAAGAKLPRSVDLRAWCAPVENQGSIQSCTAHAAVALVEIFQKRAFGKHLDASRLFLYKVTRNLLGYQEDKGANSRTTMKALALFGVPPEAYWPYEKTKVYEEPTAFCYALASSFKTHSYLRLDAQGTARELVLYKAKATLAASRPLMFSALLHQSCMRQALESGRIPVPLEKDKDCLSHTMATVGYNDDMTIENTDAGGGRTKGAFLVRNSFGTEWGEEGYGWLPYEYVLRTLSYDWWTILRQDWIDTGVFEAKV